jgi:hypothetical protein
VQLVEAWKLLVVMYSNFYVVENRLSYFFDYGFGSNSQLAIDRGSEDLSKDIMFII